jgi:glycyl-tRNA synthetase beta chain
MPELFLELFSEEIPARMQAGGAADLERLVTAVLGALQPRHMRTFHGPRRIAIRAELDRELSAETRTERGPRTSAPEQAVAGFLRKHNASRDQLREESGYWVLDRTAAAVSAEQTIAAALPTMLRRFPWPKSMRWGGTSVFTWVRPLRRIVCLLDGAVVPFDLRDGPNDDGHGLVAGDLTEGHRFHAPEAFAVRSCSDWQAQLAVRRVLVDADERKRRIVQSIDAEASAHQLELVDDPGLLDEVVGLVEWPVPLLGRIDAAFMDLPPEVRQVSMRVNQRYFSLQSRTGEPAPWFAFVSNIEPDDGGAATIAGNERVLRARFADARHFWELDRKKPLADRVPLLDAITFHAKLGSQGDRVRRLRQLARTIAPLVGADPETADRAAELAKADLVTGMVGELPELQGVTGRYYALHDGEPLAVANAVRDHYAPKGPNDPVPTAPVSVAVALADKLDQLAGFFAIGEKPSGSSDPYALRRAGLGVIRIIRENGLRLHLEPLFEAAQALVMYSEAAMQGRARPDTADLLEFLADRLRVQLRAEGQRHDVLSAVFGAERDDDFTRLLSRSNAVAALLGTETGDNLLTAYRRAANILRIESRKDGPFDGAPDRRLLREPEELSLVQALDDAEPGIQDLLAREAYHEVLNPMSRLRAPLDRFFDHVTVNAPDPELRRNRLRLLNRVRATMDRVADFSQIEG